jgi:hypothetical protein
MSGMGQQRERGHRLAGGGAERAERRGRADQHAVHLLVRSRAQQGSAGQAYHWAYEYRSRPQHTESRISLKSLGERRQASRSTACCRADRQTSREAARIQAPRRTCRQESVRRWR